jgi:3-isopropylmalate/(R)-2-methylmalate dehydratase small subunit
MAKAHVYKRDHINTDEIIPARYLNTDEEAELAKHCLEDLDKDFVKKIKKSDVIVAGEDFGCGSSREHAVWAIRGAGVQTVIAKSFAQNKTTGTDIKFAPLPDFALEIIEAGGLLNKLAEKNC